MHVGISLATLFPGRVGGSETYVRGLLGAFAGGTGPDRVTVLANRHVMDDYEPSADGRVSLHHLRSYRAGDSNVTRALAMAGATVAPALAARDVPAGLDLVHYAVTLAIPRTKLPTVVTIHDVQPHARPEAYSRALKLYRRHAYDGAARKATRVIAVSEYMREKLIEHVGVDPERVDAIHLGIDHRRFTPEASEADAEIVERLALPARYVVYPANMWPQKNHLALIEAFAAVDDPSLHLLLAGQGYGRDGQVLDRARRLGVGDRVRHLGFVAPDAMPAIYRRAQALVFPSLHEGFGAPPLEAMACGCPVASAHSGSLGEVCGDGALVFDPGDVAEMAGAIGRITSDERLRDELRERGRARARQFTWERAAMAHEAVYRRAAAT